MDDDNEDHFGCDGPLVLKGTGIVVHVVGMARRVGCSIPLEGGNRDFAVVVVVVVDVAACPVNWEDMRWKTQNIVDHILEAMMVNGDAVPIVEDGEVQAALRRMDDTPLRERGILSSHVNQMIATKKLTLNEPIALLGTVCRDPHPSKMKATVIAAEKTCVWE